ncbi:MAG: undecaprenyl/decaprenyl-phosphate alpha-N-acetylglucosaminyl 1-phosphate transferase [Ectothiorhodospiraceae bacterium]|nr:undecaprenyl/decaprenyl-phosphate alpha-N-acetylglucosaminyl 1-phosphate transferase [Paracoccaceae bacterium]MCH8505860.1 undecaprenyl/decaprenyl-phosphate alpha-N-acetylglucosaminyl 1-phosphate transferase [Ectothiorhodospiraceae bacterium]
MQSLFATITALAVSLALTPIMIRLAPVLRMLDQPGPRKVHMRPIPRVGGWGITLGAMTAVLLWLPVAPLPIAFVIGAAILLLGGALDDHGNLPALVKLAIQLTAATPVVIYAGFSMHTIPLFGEFALPLALALPLTVLGLAVCINSSNTSDGLDGLAAGITLLSLLGMSYLAFVFERSDVLLVSAAAIGGLAGFLRYNTHPATIFMGDAGSQFLGFAVGFLGLALVHTQGVGMSPWALLLLVGLPPADLAVVSIRRVLRGLHPFRPDKTHIHHRLLALGFTHSQSVIAIYLLQASFVFFGVALFSSEPWKVLLAYGLHLSLIYGFLTLAEQAYEHRMKSVQNVSEVKEERTVRPLLVWVPRVALEIMVPLTLVTFAALATHVPRDFGMLAAASFALLLLRMVRSGTPPSFMNRVPVFMTVAAVLYLYTDNPPFVSQVAQITEIMGMCAIGVMALVAVRYSPMRRRQEFRTSALDVLLIILVLLTFIAVRSSPLAFNPLFLLYAPILLYGSELLLVERRDRREWLLLAVTVSTVILMLRGFT